MRTCMLVYRSLALGLLGACFLLLATRPIYELRVVRAPPAVRVLAPRAPRVIRAPRPSATILDVAASVAPSAIGALVHLAPGERVLAVDDEPVADPIDAALRLQQRAPHAGEYVDLTVGRPGPYGHARRVLVLLH